MGVLAVCVIGLALLKRTAMSGADLGVALNLILVANTTIVRLVESWTTFETSLGAVARIRHVSLETPAEEGPDAVFGTPDQSWPSAGGVVIENCAVCYRWAIL